MPWRPVWVRAMRSASSLALAPAAHEEADAERVGQGGREAPGVLGQAVVQVAGVGVEHRHLLLAGAHHAGVRMTHVRDVVDAVQIGLAPVVEEIGALPAHHLQRTAIGYGEGRTEESAAGIQQRGGHIPGR